MNARRPEPLFLPKLWTTLREYDRPSFLADLTAGVIVGIVALPLAIAFAIGSGVTPDRGLATAIVAGFLISVLGGSRVQIGGPTGAFVVIVYGIVQKHGIDGLLVCTLMAGGMLVAMGLAGLGTVIKFIPHPVVVGFTSGIAVTIFTGQIRDLFGLRGGALPADFVARLQYYGRAMPSADPWTVGLAALSLLILFFWPRVSRRVPNSLVALLGVTAVAVLFKLPVETIGSRFHELPHGLPTPHWPAFDLSQMKRLVGPAFTVALLGAIESLLSATVADSMIESKHRSNTELIAQGIANIVSPLFGGIPATGAIARTATNIKNGARTPIAGVIHAATLFVIVLFFGHWVSLIPLCVLASILVIVSYHMSEWHAFVALLKAPRADVAVLLTTFFLTVFVDLTEAVQVGMLLSLALFMKRMADVTSIREVTQDMAGSDEERLRRRADAISRRSVPPGVVVYEAEGAFFFGVAAQLRETLTVGSKPPKVLILRMRHVLALDASGIRALDELRRGCAKMGTTLLLSGVHSQPRAALERTGTVAHFGADNVLPHIDAALERARALIAA